MIHDHVEGNGHTYHIETNSSGSVAMCCYNYHHVSQAKPVEQESLKPQGQMIYSTVVLNWTNA